MNCADCAKLELERKAAASAAAERESVKFDMVPALGRSARS
jgi:hypothetical protein